LVGKLCENFGGVNCILINKFCDHFRGSVHFYPPTPLCAATYGRIGYFSLLDQAKYYNKLTIRQQFDMHVFDISGFG